MATKCHKSVYRETVGGVFSRGKIRPVIVSIEPPNVIGFRLKGMRKTFFLTAEGCFLKAVQAQITADKREKAKAKRGRRTVNRGVL